jgi:glycosyltransferase involved in cell wall biosynthesis
LLADLGEDFAAIVETGDYEGLANAALTLLGDLPRREHLAENAKAWAREHDADRTAALVADVYRSLLNPRQNVVLL